MTINNVYLFSIPLFFVFFQGDQRMTKEIVFSGYGSGSIAPKNCFSANVMLKSSILVQYDDMESTN